jgi:hypothetical protein
MWDELHLEHMSGIRARRRDSITGIEVGVRVFVRELFLFAYRPGLVRRELRLGPYWNCGSGIIKHLQDFDRMGTYFELEERFVTRLETASIRRMAVDLCTELRAKFARTLFRMLRGRVFRRRVSACVRAKLVLSRSDAFRGLPDVLMRSIGAAWLY